MRTLALVAIVATAVLAVGCTPKPYMGESRDLHSEMGTQRGPVAAPELRPAAGALGPEAPYLPLVRPPEVQRVWITAHLNESGDMIAGHWVYLMLESSQWFLRGYQGSQELRLQLPARAPIAVRPQGQ